MIWEVTLVMQGVLFTYCSKKGICLKKVHSEKKDTVLKKDVVVLKRKENAAIRLNWKKLIRRMMLLVRITNFFTILTLKILTEEMSYVIVNTWQVM